MSLKRSESQYKNYMAHCQYQARVVKLMRMTVNDCIDIMLAAIVIIMRMTVNDCINIMLILLILKYFFSVVCTA